MSNNNDNKDELPYVADWHELLHEEFKGESDRACVILAASLLDAAMLNILKNALVPNPSSSDSLFDGANAPISTFSSRIDLLYRIGIISANMNRDLHLVRKIRNQFAHNITGCDFNESSVRDRVSLLANSSNYQDIPNEWKVKFPDTPKGKFLFTISWIQWYLREKEKTVETFHSAQLEWGYISKGGA